jgi:hypothetical protein
MPKFNPGRGSAGRMEILKKVKVNRPTPAVVAHNGKLKSKVRVKGEGKVPRGPLL